MRPLAVLVTVLGFLEGTGSPALAAEPNPAAATDQALRPCAPPDLALREVSATVGALPAAVYGLRNRGAAACRISGTAGIRMFDAQGKQIELRFGPKSAMPMLLTLAPGDEASFTVTYGRTGTEQCATAARIDVYLPPQPAPISAATSFRACALPSLRVSNLRLGVPSATPPAAPSPPAVPSPSASPAPMSSRLVT